ncbi:reverse transcriptase domain-containing protein, partial [Tanacetum coccineum]
VLQVETKEEESWMTLIHEYLLSGLLSEDSKESRKIRIKAPQYKLIRGNLYKKSFYPQWLRCIAPPKTDDQGYYWPSMHRDIARIIQDCEKCKEQSAARKRAEIRAIAAGNAWLTHGDNKQNREATNLKPTRMGGRFTSVKSNVAKDDKGRIKEVTKRKESKELASIEEA